MKDTARELPEVTAIIPVYNMERYAERSLASAIAQTYPRLRVLVIDDGSTDRSLEICRRVAAAHPNIEVISGPNAGVAVARNKGTELAGTEYVAYLDADDLWHPSKIARQVDALLAHPRGSGWIACYALFRVIGDGAAAAARHPLPAVTPCPRCALRLTPVEDMQRSTRFRYRRR